MDVDVNLSTLARMNELISDAEPQNTRNTNTWARNRYSSWAEAHNRLLPEDQAPIQFKDLDPERYNFILSKFFVEVKDCKNEDYCYKTLHGIACGLNRIGKEQHPGADADFLDFNTHRFRYLRKVLDSRIKDLQSKDRKLPNKCDIFNRDAEDLLWTHSFDSNHPRGLQRLMVFLVCKTFCCRGGQELKDIGMDRINIELLSDTEVLLTFYELKSKNHQPGLRSMNVERKIVRQLDDPNDTRSLYYNLTVYLERCHDDVRRGDARLFQHTLPTASLDDLAKRKIWYGSKRPMGKNHFSRLMGESYSLAGLEGDLTLRSIRYLLNYLYFT